MDTTKQRFVWFRGSNWSVRDIEGRDTIVSDMYMEKKAIIRRKSKKGGAGERVGYSREWLGMLASIE